MNRHLTLLILLAGILCGIPAPAQNHPNRKTKETLKYVIGTEVNLTDSVNAYKLLYENIPQDNDFLNDPIFAIIGRKQYFYFSVGANLKLGLCYDWGNPTDNPQGMSVAEIQKAPQGDNQAFQITAQSSNIYFNIIGFPTSANQTGLFFSLALDGEPGNSYKVHADNVYLRHRGFTLGYTSSLYNDRAADPYTIDGHGPIASGGHNNVLLHYQKFVTKHVRLGLGIEAPSNDMTLYVPAGLEKEQMKNVRQRVPDVPMYVTYAFNSSDHLRLSAIGRVLTYRDFVEGRNHSSFAWGLKLTGTATFGKTVVYGMAQGGKGISSYLQENRNVGLDMVPDMEQPGRLKEPVSWGTILGVQYNWKPKLFTTLVYSFLRNYVDPYDNGSGTIAYGEQMKYGQYALFNVMWRLNRLMLVGAEYVWGRKNTFGGEALSNNRLSLQVAVSF